MDFQTILYNTLLTIISTGLPILIGYAVVFIRQHLSLKQLQTAKRISLNSVQFINQTTKDLEIDNSTKLSSAIISARNLSEKVGIKLSDSQWESLIESSVIEIKKGLNTLTSEPIITPKNTPIIDSNNTTGAIATVEDLPSLEVKSGEVLLNNESIQLAESVAVPTVESIPNSAQNIPENTISIVDPIIDTAEKIKTQIIDKINNDKLIAEAKAIEEINSQFKTIVGGNIQGQ